MDFTEEKVSFDTMPKLVPSCTLLDASGAVPKDGKKLRFLRSEIDERLNGGRAKTQDDFMELNVPQTSGSHIVICILFVSLASATTSGS